MQPASRSGAFGAPNLRIRRQDPLVASRYHGLIYAAPALAVMAALILYPIVYTAILSVTNQTGGFVGPRNYLKVMGLRATSTAIWNTFVYVGGSVVLQLVVGTAAGIVLNQPFKGRAAVRSIMLVPWVIPGIVAATVWAWMFHTEFGITNYMLTAAGLLDQPKSWLTDPATVMPALIAVNVWKMFPFVAIMVLAGLQAIPATLYEAAKVDGARPVDEIRYIMLPQLRPLLAAIALLLIIWGLNGITIIYAMTQGGPANHSLITPIQIYKHAFEFFRLNEAAALSIMFFAVVTLLTAMYIRISPQGDDR